MSAPSVRPARPTTLRITFDADLAAAREVSVAFRSFLVEQGMPEKEIFSYELCIAEACYNAVEYAEGPGRDSKPVAEALFTPELIELRVTDYTPGFDLPERVPQPSPQNERGRGLFLIQAVMDEVRYFRGQGENTLVMRKRRKGLDLLKSAQAPWHAQQQLNEAKEAMARMAGELAMRSEILSAVFRCCAEMGRSESAEGFGERLLSDLLHLTSADWYVLRLLSAESRQLVVAAASDPEFSTGPIAVPAAADAAAGFEASVAANLKSVRFSVGESSDPAEPLRALGPDGAGVIHPLTFGGALVGTLAVGSRGGHFPLGRLQEEVIHAFAEFLAIQTLNFRHRTDEVRNRVVAREFEIAKEIQHLLLPRSLPQVGGFGLAGGWHSAREVGGDFYDAIALGGQSLLLMMVDVMGKGVPAALFATTLRGLLRGLASRSADPAQLLGSLNRMLFKELSAVSMFMTVQIVHVDLAERKVTAAGAGHCPLVIAHPERRTVTTLTTQGVPIGVLQESVYTNVTEMLGSPVTLLLHTDGLTDTRDAQGKMYSQRKLLAWMRANVVTGRTAAELRDMLTAEMNTFRGAAEMADDQAFLILSEEIATETPATGRGVRRIRLQPGSFLFPTNARAAHA